MKLIFLTLAAFFTGSSDAAKFLRVPQDPFDDGQDHDIGTDPDYYEVEADADDLDLVEDHSETDEGEDDGEEDAFDHGTADDPMGLAEAKEGEEEENDDSLDEADAAESTESSSTDSESVDASLIQESEEADDDAAESTDESVDVDVDAADTTEMQSSFLQESEEADSEDADDADEAEDAEEVDELTAKLNEEYSVPDSASLLQEGEALQNIPPERQYLGDLSDSKAHPYVYETREAATAACQSIGYRGLCGKSQVKGWSHCAYGWMADYKGYWFKKSKKGCGSGKGFRNGKKYIGSLKDPDAFPYVYSSRSKAAKACRKAGFRGLCAKSQIEGYVECAAGWLSDGKGYWMDRTMKGCGNGRGFRGWGKGKVGAYCCAPTANNIEYIGDLKDTKAHPYVFSTRKAAKTACKEAGYHGLCSKSQGSGFHKCAAGWYSDYKGYWMSEGRKGCGSGTGWRKWGGNKVGAYCCNLASNSKWIGSLTDQTKRYVYNSKKSAAEACHEAGYDRLCRKFEIEGYAKCAAGWMEDFKGYWFDRTAKGCGDNRGYRPWSHQKAGAYCCSPSTNVKYIGDLKKPKNHPYVYETREKAEKACKTAGYRRLCYKSEIEFRSICAAGWLKDYKGYWFKETAKGCGSGTGYRGWGKGKVGAYCCEKLELPLCHEDQLSSRKGVWRCDDYSGSTGDEASCIEKYQQIEVAGKTMHFKCVASDAGGGKFNCLAGDKCQPIFLRGTIV